jgi:hypothetical protein
MLWNHAERKNVLQNDSLQEKAARWRGVSLPKNPIAAANFIWWMLQNEFFLTMMSCKKKPDENNPHYHELASNGVQQFWMKVSYLLKTKDRQ